MIFQTKLTKSSQNFYDKVLFGILFFFYHASSSCGATRIGFRTVIINSVNKTYSLEPLLPDHNSKFLVSLKIKDNYYTLPTFLRTIETLECGLKKCDLLVTFEKNSEKSFEIFSYWLENTRPIFDTIRIVNHPENAITNEECLELTDDPFHSSDNLKIRAIKYAMIKNFSAIFVL
jgi:hypothetical protein